MRVIVERDDESRPRVLVCEVLPVVGDILYLDDAEEVEYTVTRREFTCGVMKGLMEVQTMIVYLTGGPRLYPVG